MKVIEPVDVETGKMTPIRDIINNSWREQKSSIFLAGPCPRKNYDTDDWRFEAFKILEELGYNGYVITPTNKHYNLLEKENALMEQTLWEYDAMHKCSAVVFWIPRDEEHPARTTNIEIGEFMSHQKTVVGWPDSAIHNEYIECRLKNLNKARFSNLKDLLTVAVRKANEYNQ